MRRPTLVTYGSDQQPRLLPLLESSKEETSDSEDVTPQSNNPDEDQSSEDSASLADSADYDTDLEGEGQDA